MRRGRGERVLINPCAEWAAAALVAKQAKQVDTVPHCCFENQLSMPVCLLAIISNLSYRTFAKFLVRFFQAGSY
jgi:hypothetical protein